MSIKEARISREHDRQLPSYSVGNQIQSHGTHNKVERLDPHLIRRTAPNLTVLSAHWPVT